MSTTLEQTRAVEGESVSGSAHYGLEVEGTSLIELLEGAITHADKGKSGVRALKSVILEGEGGYLTARATDRYRLIEGKIEVLEGELSPSLIALDDVNSIIALAKQGKLNNKVILNRLGDYLNIRVKDNNISIILLDDRFPDTDKLLEQPFNPSGSDLGVTDTVSFNPALLVLLVRLLAYLSLPAELRLLLLTDLLRDPHFTRFPYRDTHKLFLTFSGVRQTCVRLGTRFGHVVHHDHLWYWYILFVRH